MKAYPIKWVIDMDLPADYPKRRYNKGIIIECPVCHHKNKFYVDVSKNLAYCQSCHEGFNSTTLHAELCDISNSEANKDLENRYNGLPPAAKAKVIMQSANVPDPKPESLWVRNYVYRSFLERLTLKDEHRTSLLQRGLTEAEIEKLMLKSVPEKPVDCTYIVNELMNDKRVKGRLHRRIKIAGFYWKNDRFYADSRKSGILIPIISKLCFEDEAVKKSKFFNLTEDCENYISGFQIRYDKGEPKYVYYANQGEFSGCENIHCLLPDMEIDDELLMATGEVKLSRPVLKKVALTEGCLKADIASSLMGGYPFIAVLGVGIQKQLPQMFEMLKKEYGTEEIVLAFDQDYETNPNVQKALEQAKQKIEAAGLKYEECNWSYRFHKYGIKGIDDLLLYRKKLKEGRKNERKV